MKLRSFKVLGGKCRICMEDDPRVLDIHHVNFDGAEERKEGRTDSIARDIVKKQRAINDLALLCANCHRKIHSTFNEDLWPLVEAYVGRQRAKYLLQSTSITKILQEDPHGK